MEIVTNSPSETFKLGELILEKFPDFKIIGLFGALGTGKTCLTQGLGQALGFSPSKIKSPSYTLIREYPTPVGKFYHLDLYRLEKLDETFSESFVELLNRPFRLMVIEWAEKMQGLLPVPRLEIYLKHLKPRRRSFEIKKIAPKVREMKDQDVFKLISEFRVPEHIRRHSEQVTKIALFLGRRLKKSGVKIDLRLIKHGALLHDLLRVCDVFIWNPEAFPQAVTDRDREVWAFIRQKYHGVHHADAAYNFLKERGFPLVAEIVKKHKFICVLDPEETPRTWEEKIVYYADKRVAHGEIVSLEERIREGKARNLRTEEEFEISARAEKLVFKMEKEICEKAEIRPEEIAAAD